VDAPPWEKKRGLRKIMGSSRQEPLRNLIACEQDSENIFLQLAVYTARDGHLSKKAEDEAFRRFTDKFKKTVGHLDESRYEVGSGEVLVLDILARAWQRIKQSYRLPGIPEGFSHYVRRIISLVKRPVFSPDGSDLGNLHENPSPQKAAVIAGIAWRTFYVLLERGKVPGVRRGGTWELLPGWQQAAEDWKANEQCRLRQSGLNKIFARAWVKQKSISPASATSRVKYWRAHGEGDEEICARVGEKWITEAVKEAHDFLTEREIDAIYETSPGDGEK